MLDQIHRLPASRLDRFRRGKAKVLNGVIPSRHLESTGASSEQNCLGRIALLQQQKETVPWVPVTGIHVGWFGLSRMCMCDDDNLLNMNSSTPNTTTGPTSERIL